MVGGANNRTVGSGIKVEEPLREWYYGRMGPKQWTILLIAPSGMTGDIYIYSNVFLYANTYSSCYIATT